MLQQGINMDDRVFRKFNTYGIYAISAVVFFVLGYTVAVI